MLILAGLLIGLVGPPIERAAAHGLPARRELSAADHLRLLLMFQDVFRFIWGANPRTMDNVYLVYGKVDVGRFQRADL